MRDKELLEFREHFFEVQAIPHVLCVVTTQEPTVPREVLEVVREATSPGRERFARNDHRSHGTDPAAGLSERDRILFNTLRTWRTETARKEGVPPYVILTNQELLRVLQKQPDLLTALGHVPGVGPAKVERYGRAILSLLHGETATTHAVAAGTTTEQTAPDAKTATRAGASATTAGGPAADATGAPKSPTDSEGAR
jgi:superfamily II DNA helicase RecQ